MNEIFNVVIKVDNIASEMRKSNLGKHWENELLSYQHNDSSHQCSNGGGRKGFNCLLNKEGGEAAENIMNNFTIIRLIC